MSDAAGTPGVHAAAGEGRRVGGIEAVEPVAVGAALVGVAMAVVYWLTSFALLARSGTGHFGADAHLYQPLAVGTAIDRVARFHPTTIGIAQLWMKLTAPLQLLLSPQAVLSLLFAVIGGAGTWAATRALAMLVPLRFALAAGVIYGSSLGIWYFSSICESKIVTATLAALYVLQYLRLRQSFTTRGAVILTLILIASALNEIVSGALAVIPLVDIAWRRGMAVVRERWTALHLLAVPLTFVALEGVMNGGVVAATADQESQSHWSMLLFYIAKNDYSLTSLYSFVVNWLFFNFAAPTPTAPLWPQAGGYFMPELSGYLTSLPTILLTGAVGLFAIVLTAQRSPLSRDAAGQADAMTGLLLGLAAYALIRGAFFIVFNPSEPLLFSPAVTLAHLALLIVPFTASRLPHKEALLAAIGALVFVVNVRFMLG